MKFLIRYDRPFWREPDGGGHRRCGSTHQACTSARPAWTTHPMLVAFLGGPSSARVAANAGGRSDDEALLDRLVEAYGPQASPCRPSFVEQRLAARSVGRRRLLERPADRIADAANVLLRGAPGITFASTELAATFPGYIEGAIMPADAAAATVTDCWLRIDRRRPEQRQRPDEHAEAANSERHSEHRRRTIVERSSAAGPRLMPTATVASDAQRGCSTITRAGCQRERLSPRRELPLATTVATAAKASTTPSDEHRGPMLATNDRPARSVDDDLSAEPMSRVRTDQAQRGRPRRRPRTSSTRR